MIGSSIAGVGMAVPEREVDNRELAARLGLTPEWIRARTGIERRRVASNDDTAASLGTAASTRALAAAALDPSDIDLIVCATVTPDWLFPATACLIQDALGCGAAAYDLNAGCSGFLYALAQADAAVRAGNARRVLVVGSEVLSRIADYSEARACILFGDGAGAAVVERVEGSTRLGPWVLHSDGSRPELLYVPEETGLIHMEGREVYRAAVEGMTAATSEALTAAGLGSDDVDLFVAHQANARILDAVAARLALPSEKVFSNIAAYGNTSAASIPIALAEAHASGLLHEGDVVALAAFGAGFAWGATLVRWGQAPAGARVLVARGEAHG